MLQLRSSSSISPQVKSNSECDPKPEAKTGPSLVANSSYALAKSQYHRRGPKEEERRAQTCSGPERGCKEGFSKIKYCHRRRRLNMRDKYGTDGIYINWAENGERGGNSKEEDGRRESGGERTS